MSRFQRQRKISLPLASQSLNATYCPCISLLPTSLETQLLLLFVFFFFLFSIEARVITINIIVITESYYYLSRWGKKKHYYLLYFK